MSGNVSSRKRLIAITPGNLRNNHIYISGHHDFFPPEVYGQSSGRKSKAKSVTLQVEGLPEPITTDIAVNRSNGRPRNFFRKRAWVGRFFKKHEIREGDVVAVERLDAFNYRIYPFESNKKWAAYPLCIADARVQETVSDIGNQVCQKRQYADKTKDTHHQWYILRIRSRQQGEAHTRPREYSFCHDTAT